MGKAERVKDLKVWKKEDFCGPEFQDLLMKRVSEFCECLVCVCVSGVGACQENLWADPFSPSMWVPSVSLKYGYVQNGATFPFFYLLVPMCFKGKWTGASKDESQPPPMHTLSFNFSQLSNSVRR